MAIPAEANFPIVSAFRSIVPRQPPAQLSLLSNAPRKFRPFGCARQHQSCAHSLQAETVI